jgi:hypothetical protein
MSHLIDMSDHYAQFDQSISTYNYMKYSERQWRLFNNKLQYQNRLRITDYRDIHHVTGFEILDEQNLSGSLDALSAVKLAPQFESISQEDLLVTNSWMVSRPQYFG